MENTLTVDLEAALASERLNQNCFCATLDRTALCRAFEEAVGDPLFCAKLMETRPHLFSNTPVFVPRSAVNAMKDVVLAIETLAAEPAYQSIVLSRAPAIARTDHGPLGVFMGYDFHVGEGGPQLIEVNTNAGGAFLNAALAEAQTSCCRELLDVAQPARAREFDDRVAAMFAAEWRMQRGDVPVGRIAVVEDGPEDQYLYPEFILCRQMLRKAGFDVEIVDGRDLIFEGGRLLSRGRKVDMAYNRLVDFDLSRDEHRALRQAYVEGAVVLTPNPRNHALLADKRNLALLSDPDFLAGLDVTAETRSLLLATIPKTVLVSPTNADALWAVRNGLFFKPAAGHASKAVYRGDKVTRRVWSEVVDGGYVAQVFAAPSERAMKVDGVRVPRKVDVRLYTYAGRVLLAAARVYQGQTTNMRTPGGGFAPVFVI